MSIYVQALGLVKLHYPPHPPSHLTSLFHLIHKLSLVDGYENYNTWLCVSLTPLRRVFFCGVNGEVKKHTHTCTRALKTSCWDKPFQFTAWQLVNVVWLVWEQKMHCRNSRLHVINPIPAITLSDVYCIPLSVLRETNEDLTHPWESAASR